MKSLHERTKSISIIGRLLLLGAVAWGLATGWHISFALPGETSALPVGDYDGNGKVETADGVAFLKSMGIGFYTYGVVDDTYNRGVGLKRRWNWPGGGQADGRVYAYSEKCLDRSPTVFPPEKIPGMDTLVGTLLGLPTQHLRALGRLGYRIMIFDDIGRLAKPWKGVHGNSWDTVLYFFHTGTGYGGRARFKQSGAGEWGPWEELSKITFNPSTGALSFRREGPRQTWTGTVNASSDWVGQGTSASGTIRTDGSVQTVTWQVAAEHRTGATSGLYFGDGLETQCKDTGISLGKTGPGTEFNLGSITNRLTIAHEIGHTIQWAIENHSGTYTAADSAEFKIRFPGFNSCVYNQDPNCPTPGSGYVTPYAANTNEDMSETFGYYQIQRFTLDANINEDLKRGNTALQEKKKFIEDRVDVPDAAPHGTVFGGHEIYFMPRNVITLADGATAGGRPYPSGGESHFALGSVSDGSTLWKFAVGKDNAVYWDSYDSIEQDSGWTRFGPFTVRLPVSAAWSTQRDEAVVVMGATDGGLWYQTFTHQSVLKKQGALPGITTRYPFGIAQCAGGLFLVAVDLDHRTKYTSLDDNLNPSGWKEFPGKFRAREGISVSKDGSSCVVLATDANFRVSSTQIFGSSNISASWKTEFPNHVFGTPSFIEATRTVLVKGGEDGAVYRATLGGSGFSLVPGL